MQWDLRVAGLREKEQPKGKGWASKDLVRGRPARSWRAGAVEAAGKEKKGVAEGKAAVLVVVCGGSLVGKKKKRNGDEGGGGGVGGCLPGEGEES
jgi:hypothetical protein